MPECRVLVAYASKYGATAGIAERIGEVLRRQGVQADVVSAERAGDLAPYTAVVVGSGVYAGNWLKGAATFLTRHEAELTGRPVWLFSDGPTGEGDPVALMKGWRFPQSLQPVADRIRPRDIVLFHGALDPAKLNWAERLILRAIKAPVGDYRDWPAIEAWAGEVAKACA